MPDTHNSNPEPNLPVLAFEETLKDMLQATAGQLGEDFLHSLAAELCQAPDIDAIIIAGIIDKNPQSMQTVAVYADKQAQTNFQFDLDAGVFQAVIENKSFYIAENAQSVFPHDGVLAAYNAEGALGVVLTDSQQQLVGVLLGLGKKPLKQNHLINNLFDVFAFRVAAELERRVITKNLRNEVIINQTQLDSVPALMFMLDREGRLLRWNQYFCSKFGFSHEQMQAASLLMVVEESDKKRMQLEIEAIFNKGRGTVYLNGVTENAEVVPLLATLEAANYEDTQVLVGVALDMTEQQSVERNLLRSQGRLARKNSQLSLITSLVEKLHASHSVKHIAKQVVDLLHSLRLSSTISFSVVQMSGNKLEIIASSGASKKLVDMRRSFSPDEEGSPTAIALESQTLELFPSIRDDERISKPLRNALLAEGIVSGVVVPFVYQGQSLGAIAIGHKSYTHVDQEEIEFYQTISGSISLALANARQYEMMEVLATRDNLTGLPNRNAFNQECEKALNALQESDGFLGLILMDLDRFKEINDTLDHRIGDKLLRMVGPRIIDELQDPQISVYRLGGDEFCLLVAHKNSASEVESIAKAVEKVMRKTFEIDGLNLDISSSIGVATTQGGRQSSPEMLRLTELAMYQAKSKRSGIAVYSPDLDANTNQRFVIMAEMAEAIRNDELLLQFQPKYDLKSRRIIGCEALVRWQHKKYGVLLPAKFIPQVELTQLIGPLTYWVIKTAMAQLQEWKRQGMQISMAVNLSTRNLADDEFIPQVDELLKKYDVDPQEMEFEVTETAVMGDLKQAKSQLQAISARGIQCSLDDYGTGYSSLAYIKQLPLDILKIDRSFISQMLAEKEDQIIARSTINLAHRLGMKVIAEGVEDEDTLTALTEHGCDFIQGYFISQPLDAESFAKLYWLHNDPLA